MTTLRTVHVERVGSDALDGEVYGAELEPRSHILFAPRVGISVCKREG